MIYFLLLTLGFICSFSPCFRCKFRLVVWDFFLVPKVSLCCYKLHSSRTAFAVSHRFWIIMFSFPFVSGYFLISSLISSMIHWLFNRILLKLPRLLFFLQLFPYIVYF